MHATRACVKIELTPAGEQEDALPMADSHGAVPDPNAAPMHHDIHERFTALQVTIAVGLGVIAIAAGIVCGIIFVNN